MAETKISADASAHGLGAVLLQQQNNTWHPVAFASRSLSEMECRYAQIEKEALALHWRDSQSIYWEKLYRSQAPHSSSRGEKP